MAPGVTFGADRVGCESSTEADIMLHAMEKALADKMNVVNLPIGSTFSSWQEDPTSQATDARACEGVIVPASIGNEIPIARGTDYPDAPTAARSRR